MAKHTSLEIRHSLLHKLKEGTTRTQGPPTLCATSSSRRATIAEVGKAQGAAITQSLQGQPVSPKQATGPLRRATMWNDLSAYLCGCVDPVDESPRHVHLTRDYDEESADATSREIPGWVSWRRTAISRRTERS